MRNQKMSTRNVITLALLVAMSFFLMCDLYITPAVVTELATEFNVPKSSIGYVGSAFVLVGALISVYFGYMTDKFSRKKLLVLTVLIGEIPCFLTGLHGVTATFQGFLIMRILTGIGVGGIYPLTFSLLSDYFSDEHRATAAAFIDVSWGLGMIAGPLLANIGLSSTYGWRLAFILAAVPNFPLAILFSLYAKDPQRGTTEKALARAIDDGAEYTHKIKAKDFKLLFSNKTNILLFLQGMPGCIPWGILTFWAITFFKETQGMSQGDATLLWELFGICSTVGGLVWAITGDKIFKRNVKALPAFCATGIALGVIPCYIFLNQEMPPVSLMLPLVAVGGMLVTVAGSNVKAMLMNVNRPEHRGSVFALFNLSDSIGKGLGPAVGSAILATTGSYKIMMNLGVSFWLLCSLIFFGVIFTIKKDRAAMLKLMEERSQEITSASPIE